MRDSSIPLLVLIWSLGLVASMAWIGVWIGPVYLLASFIGSVIERCRHHEKQCEENRKRYEKETANRFINQEPCREWWRHLN